MSDRPVVSVVIPTFGRPALVLRAVRSALAQTLQNIEVLVIIDGPDDGETAGALAAIVDTRLRVLTLPEKGGAPNARNYGVNEAQSPWTALLDDDDEWLPAKLATQLDLAQASGIAMPIVASRLINRTPRAEFVMPRRLPTAGEPLSEYLTVRHGLFHGDGFIQTSTIMAPTALLRRVPFTVGLRRFQELDWTLRALGHDGVDLIYPVEPLVVWHQDENRPRISHESPWQQSIAWLDRIRPLITRRAYAALATSVVASTAAPTRRWSLFRSLLRDARRHGDPGLVDYVTYLQIWVLPPQMRRTLRDLVLRRRTGTPTAPTSPAAPDAALH